MQSPPLTCHSLRYRVLEQGWWTAAKQGSDCSWSPQSCGRWWSWKDKETADMTMTCLKNLMRAMMDRKSVKRWFEREFLLSGWVSKGTESLIWNETFSRKRTDRRTSTGFDHDPCVWNIECYSKYRLELSVSVSRKSISPSSIRRARSFQASLGTGSKREICWQILARCQ